MTTGWLTCFPTIPTSSPDPGPNTRFIDWHVTSDSSLDGPLEPWVSLQLIPMADGRTQLEWVWKANDDDDNNNSGGGGGSISSNNRNNKRQPRERFVGHGYFDPTTAAFTLSFEASGESVTVTHRILDPATMAVCVVTTTTRDVPTVQYSAETMVQTAHIKHVDIVSLKRV